MGKRQHQKDKMHLTYSEWAWLYGGKRPNQRQLDEVAAKIARLPFDHCCLSLQPTVHPVASRAGYVFEKDNLHKFVARFKCDPITGDKSFSLDKDVFPIKFHKNSDGHFQCPVLMKSFTDNSKLATVTSSGNVYLYEAVEELNLKTKNFRDLLTDEPFVRKDVIILQDPLNSEKKNPSQFHVFVHKLNWMQETEEIDDGRSRLNKMGHVIASTLKELDATYVSKGGYSSAVTTPNLPGVKDAMAGDGASSSSGPSTSRDRFNEANFSTGRVAASLTSSVMGPVTNMEAAILEDNVFRYGNVKKKGYVQVDTSLGPLNLELYCQFAPKTCDNFLQLARKDYFDGTIFHRLIKNFMIQAGDPTGTGTGGQSIWGQPFEDEFSQHLSHTGRGMVSMANSGPGSNKSQFFITFRSCKHLDRKHSIFGKVVGGFETLDRMEKIPTDAKDKPKDAIYIKKVNIFVDPFKEMDDMMEEERRKETDSAKKGSKNAAPEKPKVFRSGVGSFIDLNKLHASQDSHLKEDKEEKKWGGEGGGGGLSSGAAASNSGMNNQTRKKERKNVEFSHFNNW